MYGPSVLYDNIDKSATHETQHTGSTHIQLHKRAHTYTENFSNLTLFELGFQKNYMLEMVEIFNRVCWVNSVLIFENDLKIHGHTHYFRPVLHV